MADQLPLGFTRKGMGGHHRPVRGDTDTWLTPPWIIDRLGPFDLDPCAAPDPRPWPTAREHIALPNDGLAAPWTGSVWLNPPYGPATWRWLHRLADHPPGGIALIFARTETAGFHAWAFGRATAMLFLAGRLTFHLPDGQPGAGNAGAPSVLVAYGDDHADRLRRSRIDGALVETWATTGADRLPNLGVD